MIFPNNYNVFAVVKPLSDAVPSCLTCAPLHVKSSCAPQQPFHGRHIKTGVSAIPVPLLAVVPHGAAGSSSLPAVVPQRAAGSRHGASWHPRVTKTLVLSFEKSMEKMT